MCLFVHIYDQKVRLTQICLKRPFHDKADQDRIKKIYKLIVHIYAKI